jgi:hypothetical protein
MINNYLKQILLFVLNEDSEETRTSYNDIKLNKKEQIFQVIGDPTQERYIYLHYWKKRTVKRVIL